MTLGKRWTTAIRQALILTLVAGVLGILYNAWSISGIPLVGDWSGPGAGSAGAGKGPVGKAAEIGMEQAYKLYNKGHLFVDARTQQDFEEGRIAKSLWLPIWSLDSHITAFTATVPKSRLIISYCNGGDCEDSHFLAEDLMSKYGYTNVMVYMGGYPEWNKAGYPVEKGKVTP